VGDVGGVKSLFLIKLSSSFIKNAISTKKPLQIFLKGLEYLE